MRSGQPNTNRYSETFLARLFERYKIDEQHHWFTRGMLEYAAKNWQVATTERLTPKERRNLLLNLLKAVEAFQAELSAMPSGLWQAMMDAPDFEIRNEFHSHLYQQYEEAYHAGHRLQGEDTDLEPPDAYLVPVEVNQKALRNELTCVAQSITSLLSHSPEVKRGMPSNDDLRVWVRTISDLWTDHLHRPFTRDVAPNGEPVSEAARFCVDVFHEVEPSVPPSRVLNAMKQVISERRQWQRNSPDHT